MSANSNLRLEQYTVKKLFFQLNNDFDFRQRRNIKIDPEFLRRIQHISDDEYAINLRVKICEKSQKGNIPFYAEVEIEGVFHFESWEASEKRFISINNATAILFPYLRSLLSSITTTGNLPPYFLPVMNVTELFRDQEN